MAEAARNLICSGAEPIAVTDCLNFGSPDKPEVFWQLEKSADGISEACVALNAPIISGNVSLSNEVNGKPIYPTPTLGMVGLIQDLNYVVTSDAKQAGDAVYVVGEAKPEFGGSELQQMLEGKISGKAPALDLAVEAKRQQDVLAAIRKGLVQSASDVSEGGLAVALCEAVFGNELGLDVTLTGEAVTALFSETQSRFVLTVAQEDVQAFEAIVTDAKQVGVVTNNNTITINGEDGVLVTGTTAEFRDAWKGAIACLLK